MFSTAAFCVVVKTSKLCIFRSPDACVNVDMRLKAFHSKLLMRPNARKFLLFRCVVNTKFIGFEPTLGFRTMHAKPDFHFRLKSKQNILPPVA